MIQAIQQTNIAFFVEPTINRLFQIREEIRTLQKSEKELTADIVRFMETKRLTQIVAGKIHALMSTAKRLDINANQYRQRVSESQFMETISVSVTKARDYLSESDIEKISSVSRFNQLRLSKSNR
jgi:hypothetical protein